MRAHRVLTGILIAFAIVFVAVVQSGSAESPQQGLGGTGRGVPPELLQCADLFAIGPISGATARPTGR